MLESGLESFLQEFASSDGTRSLCSFYFHTHCFQRFLRQGAHGTSASDLHRLTVVAKLYMRTTFVVIEHAPRRGFDRSVNLASRSLSRLRQNCPDIPAHACHWKMFSCLFAVEEDEQVVRKCQNYACCQGAVCSPLCQFRFRPFATASVRCVLSASILLQAQTV